jgi:hypothetical protein
MQSYLYEAALRGNAEMLTELVDRSRRSGFKPKFGNRTAASSMPGSAAVALDAHAAAPSLSSSVVAYTRGAVSAYAWAHTSLVRPS